MSEQEPGHSQVTFKCKEQKTAIRSKQEPGISQVTTKSHKKDKKGKTSLTFPSGWSWLLLCWCWCLPAAHASLTSCSSHLVAYTSLNGSLPVAMGSDAMELWNGTCDLLLPSQVPSPAHAAAGDVLMHFDEPWQSFGILALEVFPLFSPELPWTWLFCAATSLLSWLIGRQRKRKRVKKHVKHCAHLKRKKQRTRKVRVLQICRFAGCTRVRAPRLICRRKRMKLWLQRRSFRFSVPWKKQSPNVCESRHPGPGWSHFSKRYLDLILSPVLAGGASATWGFRRKRNRKVTAQNQANEFTRDIIALLKSCLNQGTSPDQLGNAVQKCDKSGSSLGVITPILTPFPPLLSLRVTPLVLSSCLFGSSRGFCPCSPKGRLFPPTWMIVVSLRCPLPPCASLCPGGRLGLLVWACLRALPKLWPLGAGLPSVLCCSPSLSRRWSRAGSVSLVRVPTRLPVVLPRLNLSESLRRCNVSLSWVALGSTFPTSLPTVVCSPSPRLVSVGLRVPLPSMRLNGCSRLSGRTLGVSVSPIPGFGPCCWGGMSIWILLGSPGWLGVSSVALFGIAPVGLCVRARWRPVFMAGLSIGGGVLFGSGSGNTTSLLSVWIFSPLGFCPPFFLAWRVWPSIIFVKDGEPGVFRSGPIQAGTKCNNSKKLPALSFAA